MAQWVQIIFRGCNVKEKGVHWGLGTLSDRKFLKFNPIGLEVFFPLPFILLLELR